MATELIRVYPEPDVTGSTTIGDTGLRREGALEIVTGLAGLEAGFQLLHARSYPCSQLPPASLAGPRRFGVSAVAWSGSSGRRVICGGAGLGGLPGLLVGLWGGPLGLVFGGSWGALAGGGFGAPRERASTRAIDSLEAALPPDASMLILVGESNVLDELVAATGAEPSGIVRQPLTSEQAEELSKAARR